MGLYFILMAKIVKHANLSGAEQDPKAGNYCRPGKKRIRKGYFLTAQKNNLAIEL